MLYLLNLKFGNGTAIAYSPIYTNAADMWSVGSSIHDFDCTQKYDGYAT